MASALVGGGGGLQGVGITVINDTVASSTITGVKIQIEPNITGVSSVRGIHINSAGSETGDSGVYMEGLWVNGIDLSPATLTTADIVLQNGEYIKNSTDGTVETDGVFKADGGIRTKLSTADVSNPPLDAELDSEFGTPATIGAGFTAIVDDNAGGANVYIVVSDGTNWHVIAISTGH